MKKIYAVILAAGLSKRFSSNKLIVRIDGEPIIRLAVTPFIMERIEERFVIFGKEREKLEDYIRDLPVKILLNPYSEEGISSSIKVSIPYLDGAEGVFLHLADKPFVSSSLLKNMIDIYESEDRMALLPAYRGIRGHPVLVNTKILRKEMSKLRGDKGLRDILKDYEESIKILEADWGCTFDIDRKEDLEILRERGFKVEES